MKVGVLRHFSLWRLGLAKANTETTEAERECLSRHAAGKRRLAEIGVLEGVTTCRLRKAMAPDATIFAVDPYPIGRLGFSLHQVIAHSEVAKVPNGKVEWIRQTGAQAAQSLRVFAPFDFVFIDGDHSYEGIQADWLGWSQLVSVDGIVALHDTRPTADGTIVAENGSVRFTNDTVLRDGDFTVAATVDSLTVMRRVAQASCASVSMSGEP
jgi:predicted O-methyltransferase YrrM